MQCNRVTRASVLSTHLIVILSLKAAERLYDVRLFPRNEHHSCVFPYAAGLGIPFEYFYVPKQF